MTWRRGSGLLPVRRPSSGREGRGDLPAKRRFAFRGGAAIFLLLAALVLVVGRAHSQIIVGPYTATNITTATSTVVTPRPGVLHLVTINTSSPGTIILRDSATCPGTITIGTIWGNVALTGQTFLYDVSLEKGLCVLTSAGTDLTVSWR